MTKQKVALPFVLAVSCAVSWAQVTGDFTVTATPSLNLPLGPTLSASDSTKLYGLGYGVTVRGEYAMPFLRALSAGIAMDADFAPLNASTVTASFLGVSGEAAFRLFPVQRLGLRLGARAGL